MIDFKAYESAFRTEFRDLMDLLISYLLFLLQRGDGEGGFVVQL